MALLTISQQLEEVQASITAVTTNQSYSIHGRTYTRADLKDLSDREETLIERGRKYGFDTVYGTNTSTKAGYNVIFTG